MRFIERGPHFVTRRTQRVTLGIRNGVKSLTETGTADRLASAVGWPDFLRWGGVEAAGGGALSRRLAYMSLHLRRRDVVAGIGNARQSDDEMRGGPQVGDDEMSQSRSAFYDRRRK